MGYNREDLIKLSVYYDGEYSKITDAISNGMHIEHMSTIPENAITIFDNDYPKELLDLKYPPYVLYYKGNKQLLRDKKVAIIGSRIPSDYANKATAQLANSLDKVVVSGLAKGIDATAHINAEKTIAVLGCGIDYIYPYCNYELFNHIEKEGLILSEYPYMVKPLAYHFPQRNRIIAALSEKLYVMECRGKSGTSTTIGVALDLNKDVCVLPFNAFDAKANNIINNDLIDEGAMVIKF